MNKKELLAKYLECEVDDLNVTDYDENTFEYGRQEYSILTDNEANEKTKNYILDSLWAFNADFILQHSKLNDWNDRTEKAFKKMQEELCEDANEIVKALICDDNGDCDAFVEDAIDADGRGHFIAGYDGEENEIQDDDNTWYYIYRNN